MSLLFVDGFDHYATADILKKWNSSAQATIGGGGRRSSGALTLAGNTANAVKTLPASYATLVVGFSYNPAASSSNNFLSFLDSGTVHCGLYLTGLGAISAWRATNATVLGTSANGVIAPSGFSYVECKVTIHDTAGTVDVRVNGASVLSLSGVDTRNAATATCNQFQVQGMPSVGAVVDDLYCCDTSGTTNNNFLGDVRVDTLFPNADGAYSQFTPSTGTSHFALVDETAPNTTDYNDGNAVGDRDSYALQNLTALASQIIYGVQVNAAVMKDDAGAKSAGTMVRSGTTDGDGASAPLGTSQSYIRQVYETDPAISAAWTESTVNGMEAGVKVTA